MERDTTIDTGSAPADGIADGQTGDDPTTGDGLVEDELLVEEISIDGMCGVY